VADFKELSTLRMTTKNLSPDDFVSTLTVHPRTSQVPNEDTNHNVLPVKSVFHVNDWTQCGPYWGGGLHATRLLRWKGQPKTAKFGSTDR
jgi:hypothetical protein